MSEASIWHRKIRLMRKYYSWGCWGSPSQKTEQQAGELRQAGLYGREHWPRSPESQISEEAWGQPSSQEFVTCLLHCATNTKWSSSPISLCHSLLFQSVPETDHNWPALPTDISSNICSCVHLQTLTIYHVEASCVDLCLGPNLAFYFWWIWAVDWLFINSLFQWWFWKGFLQNLWVPVWFVCGLWFLCCIML